jgi:hypothetical protein
LDLALRGIAEKRAHVDGDVQGHIEKRSIGNVGYDVAEKHLETNLHIICAAVSRSTTVMTPPHWGQVQHGPVREISVERIMGAIPSRWRQSSSDEDLW